MMELPSLLASLGIPESDIILFDRTTHRPAQAVTIDDGVRRQTSAWRGENRLSIRTEFRRRNHASMFKRVDHFSGGDVPKSSRVVFGSRENLFLIFAEPGQRDDVRVAVQHGDRFACSAVPNTSGGLVETRRHEQILPGWTEGHVLLVFIEMPLATYHVD